MTYTFAWKNNPERAKYYGKYCRIIAHGKMGSSLVEFDDGHRMITSRRALRKVRQNEL